ncbi:MAG: hypothetical protein IJX77_08985 [Ruminococcus sp.]|nr:hypothetical protein [Ruminococcus sp.]
MHFIKKIISSLAVCAVVAVSAPLAGGSSLNAGAAETYISQCREMIELINNYRAQNGQKPLKLYITGCDAAMARSQEIVSVFSHTRPDGSGFYTILEDYNISYSVAGENIASGFDSVESVMGAWMNSSGHRANILSSNYDYIGIGINDGCWSQIFLRMPAASSAKGDVNNDKVINAIDASGVLQYYAYQATAAWFEQTDSFIRSADVDSNGVINAIDASGILKYYAESSTGKTPSF